MYYIVPNLTKVSSFAIVQLSIRIEIHWSAHSQDGNRTAACSLVLCHVLWYHLGVVRFSGVNRWEKGHPTSTYNKTLKLCTYSRRLLRHVGDSVEWKRQRRRPFWEPISYSLLVVLLLLLCTYSVLVIIMKFHSCVVFRSFRRVSLVILLRLLYHNI